MLFSAPMVRALLDGSKTQTRRVVKPKAAASLDWFGGTSGPDDDRELDELLGQRIEEKGIRFWCADYPEEGSQIVKPPYGQPGGQSWVKETFYAFGRWETRFDANKGRDAWHFVDMTLECGHAYRYAATDSNPVPMRGRRSSGVTPGWWKRPAIFMPRAASRITLEIVSVRVKRLQDISDADAMAEGIVKLRDDGFGLPDGSHYHAADPRQSYFSLWEAINGVGSVEANPWVWCIEFKLVSS